MKATFSTGRITRFSFKDYDKQTVIGYQVDWFISDKTPYIYPLVHTEYYVPPVQRIAKWEEAVAGTFKLPDTVFDVFHVVRRNKTLNAFVMIDGDGYPMDDWKKIGEEIIANGPQTKRSFIKAHNEKMKWHNEEKAYSLKQSEMMYQDGLTGQELADKYAKDTKPINTEEGTFRTLVAVDITMIVIAAVLWLIVT